MIKKFLSATLFGVLALGLAGTFVACDDYDDSDLRMRVEALEGTLADLQAQIENGGMIASVTPSADGITITMTDGSTYNITNGAKGDKGDKGDTGATGAQGEPGSVVEIGENGNWFIDGVDTGNPSRGAAGQDGADGEDGYVPQIEIIDGYWYIDGVNTNQPAQGEQGPQGPAGADGQDGAQGPQGPQGPAGADGEDGTVITINEDGYWVIDGVPTDVLARGENGQDGADGQDGQDGQDGKDAQMVYYVPDASGYWAKVTCENDGTQITYEVDETMPWLPVGTITAVYNTDSQVLTLYNVEDENGEYTTVAIKLSQPLVGLAFIPDVIKEGYGVTTYYSLSVEKELHNPAKGYNFLVSSDIVMDFRLNPNNADLTNLQDKSAWSFINRTVEVRSAADETNLLEIKDIDLSEAGKVIVTSVTTEEDPSATYTDTDNKEILVALRANDKTQSGADRIITSDYSIVDYELLNDFAIAKKHKLPITSNTERYYTEVKPSVVDDTEGAFDAWFIYTDQLNLNTLAEAWAKSNKHISLAEAGFEEYLTYTFEETKVKGVDGTEQDYYTTITENEDGDYIMTVDAGPAGTPTEAAIGRRPVVKANAFINGTKIAEGYIVIEVRRTPVTEIEEYPVPDKNVSVNYTTLPDAGDWKQVYSFNWATVNDEIYREVGIAPEDFASLYDYANTTYSPEAEVTDGVKVVVNPFNSDPTLTDGLIELYLNDQVYIPNGAKEGNGTVKVTIPAYDNTAYPDIVITINYTVVDDCVEPVLNPNYASNNTQVVRGTLDKTSATPQWIMKTTMAEAFVDYLADFGNGNHTYEFRLTTPRSDVAISPIDGTTVTDFRQQTIELVTELAENEVRRVNVQLVEKRDNGTEHYFSYIVEFRSPFDINVAEPIACIADDRRLCQPCRCKPHRGQHLAVD